MKLDLSLNFWAKCLLFVSLAVAPYASAMALQGGNSTNRSSWRQLRGENQGHAGDNAQLPEEWSETKNVRWKTALPGAGWSSPVIDSGQIWLTTSIDEERSLRVLCIDEATGEIRTDVEVFKPAELVAKHERNGHATPTPVLDQDRIYVHFGSYGTAALDRKDGSVVWTNQETVINHQWGPGSSPILYNDLLVFNCDGMDVRYVIALDKETGKVVWKTDRSVEITKGGFFRKAFSTPAIAKVNGTEMLITAGANQVSALTTNEGDEVWVKDYFGYAGVTVPVVADGRAFVTSGYGDGSILAIRLDDSEKSKAGEVVWSTRQNAPIIPTPIVVGSELYMVSDNGIFTCLDAATGKVHWKQRLKGNYAASIVYGDGKLFVSSDQGETHVVKPSKEKCQIVATNQLDSNIQATPAIIDNAIYIRTKKSFYRIENAK